MKVTIVLLAVVVVALADTYKSSSGYKHADYSHPPNYKFDWAVKDDKYYNDYGQYETRDGYHTKGNWWVALPGKSHIKEDYDVDSKAHGDYKKDY